MCSARETFDNIRQWMDQIKANADSGVDVILVGNKCDIDESLRAVPREEAQALATAYGVVFFEVSAKGGVNVDEAFLEIAQQSKVTMQAKIARGEIAPAGIPIVLGGEKPKSKCC